MITVRTSNKRTNALAALGRSSMIKFLITLLYIHDINLATRVWRIIFTNLFIIFIFQMVTTLTGFNSADAI